jgi:hypothetical protein
MLLAVLVGILVAAQHQYVKVKYPDPSCPAGKIEKQDAYDDVVSKQPKGLMTCYCEKLYRRSKFATLTHTFTKESPNKNDKTKYCYQTAEKMGIHELSDTA